MTARKKHYHQYNYCSTKLLNKNNFQNTDASLLATVSWPAFGIHEEPIRSRTIDKVIRKLKGQKGIKRFIRDGYKTVVEDKNRKYYKPAEIKVPAKTCFVWCLM